MAIVRGAFQINPSVFPSNALCSILSTRINPSSVIRSVIGIKSEAHAASAITPQMEFHQVGRPATEMRVSSHAIRAAMAALKIVRPCAPPSCHTRLTTWSKSQLTFAVG